MTKSFAVGLDRAAFEAVFGKKPDVQHGARSRLCIVCGDWHDLARPWPHNCRPEAPPRSKLAAPRIAPKFEPFKPSHFADAIISDPRSKRDYMERNELVEYDAGVKPEPEPTDRQWEAEFVEDFKIAQQIDPLNVKPVDVVGRTDLNESPEINATDIEVFK